MKTKLRILSLLLAAILLVPTLAACAEDTPPAEDTTDSAADSTDSVTAPADTEPAGTRIDPKLPEMNLDGYTITFFGKEVDGVCVEEETGDIVDDSVFKRNSALNEQYNFNVEHIAASNQEKAIVEAFQTIRAGDDAYQVLLDGGERFVQYITAGLLYDLNTLKYQDFTQPWWYQYLNEGLSINEKLYMSANAFMLTTKTQLYGTVVNRKLAEDNGVDVAELYQLGREGKWTLDHFIELSRLGSADLNADGVRDYTDQWGLQIQAYCGYSLALGCGFRIADKNADDIPYITAGTEESINIWDKLTNSLFSDGTTMLATQNITGVESTWTAASEMWNSGRVLVTVGSPANSWRELDFEYCFLPSPKYTEEQAMYYHTGSSWNTPLMGVPVTVEDIEGVSFIIEAMAYSSYYDVLPDFYENYLQMRLLRDKESIEMLEIVQSTPFFDIGAVFNWNNYLSNLYTIVTSGTNNLATLSAKIDTAANAAIKKQISQIEKVEAERAGN